MDPSDSTLLRACRCEPVGHTPVWFMRQAGRSLPEYRELRGEASVLEAIARPELAAELTLQPVRRYGVDAAILFSDIVVPLVAIGLEIEIVPGRGPVLEHPFGSDRDLERLRPLEPLRDLAPVIETVRILRGELDVPLIGFAGAPFTLASYLVEGGPSRTFGATKALMHAEPKLWHALVDRLAGICLASLRAQVEAGVSAIQLFDSWAGALSPADYEEFALPASRTILEGIADLGVPRIHFGVGTGELLGLMAAAGADVLGVDWRVPLRAAAKRAGRPMALQGNLDPAICLAPLDVVLEEAGRVLSEARSLPGHVFNLGHGVLPETDPGVLGAVVELVHEVTSTSCLP
ncbi:MAG: uroporphyrinogen decarboxylase [Actinomycetota bacterium]|nr:uroporphyrinogen decarboxylase [Actinomycetota bacterium]